MRLPLANPSAPVSRWTLLNDNEVTAVIADLDGQLVTFWKVAWWTVPNDERWYLTRIAGVVADSAAAAKPARVQVFVGQPRTILQGPSTGPDPACLIASASVPTDSFHQAVVIDPNTPVVVEPGQTIAVVFEHLAATTYAAGDDPVTTKCVGRLTRTVYKEAQA